MTAPSLLLIATLSILQQPAEQMAEAPEPGLNDSDFMESARQSAEAAGETPTDAEGAPAAPAAGLLDRDLSGRFGVVEGEGAPASFPPPRPSATQTFPPPLVEVQTVPEPPFSWASLEWQQAFAPATWPIWALALIALGGLLKGFRTIALLRRETEILTGPRLHLENVSFTGLVAGSRPVFFVRIGNAGGSDAHEVRVTISAMYQGGGGKTGAPQTMLIPAHSSREFFLRWQTALTTAVRDDIRGGTSKLCVKVAIEHGGGEPQKHCYQFYPWDEDRPPGVPDFVPCDLDSQLGGFATGRTARFATDDAALIYPVLPRRVAEETEDAEPELVRD